MEKSKEYKSSQEDDVLIANEPHKGWGGDWTDCPFSS